MSKDINELAIPSSDNRDGNPDAHGICYLGEGRPLSREEKIMVDRLITIGRANGHPVIGHVDDLRVLLEDNWYGEGRVRSLRFTLEKRTRCRSVGDMFLENKTQAFMCCTPEGKIVYIETF